MLVLRALVDLRSYEALKIISIGMVYALADNSYCLAWVLSWQWAMGDGLTVPGKPAWAPLQCSVTSALFGLGVNSCTGDARTVLVCCFCV